MIAQIGKIGADCGGIHRYQHGLVRELARLKTPCQIIEGRRGNLPYRLGTTWLSGRQVLANNSIDLVAAHFALYTWPILNLLNGLPLVVHCHGPWSMESELEGDNRLWVAGKRRMELAVYRRASHVITLSNAFATIVREQYGIPHERIRVIPGGVDLDHFSESLPQSEARVRLGWPTNRPIIVTVRRLVNRMGLPVLIEAISEVRRRHADVLVQICGAGHLRDSLASQVKELGLERNINLVGYVDEPTLPLVYRAADFSVVPSLKYEGFGLAAAESLAAGTPALVTNVDGLPEVISPLSANLIVKPGSKEDLAERIGQLLTRPADFPSATTCRSYAAGRFAWPLIAEQILAVYREATQQSTSKLPIIRFSDDLPDIAPAG